MFIFYATNLILEFVDEKTMQAVLVAPYGREVKVGHIPQCCAPYGHLHWATIVTHYVR